MSVGHRKPETYRATSCICMMSVYCEACCCERSETAAKQKVQRLCCGGNAVVQPFLQQEEKTNEDCDTGSQFTGSRCGSECF